MTTARRKMMSAAYSHMRLLDVTYWCFFTPFVTGVLTRLTTLGAFGLLAFLIERSTLSFGFWIELPLALVYADFVGYWSHRMRHRDLFWRFHAIHHSPTKLDALAAARMHPIDDMIDNTLVGAALFVAGFSPQVIFAIGPILFLHIALTHADVSWSFGPLRKIFVSPQNHRAHHQIGAARNYAGMFSFIDVIFGTYGESDKQEYGSGEAIPESLLGHLMWPLHVTRQRLDAPRRYES